MSSSSSPVLVLEPRWVGWRWRPSRRLVRATWQQSGLWLLLTAAGQTHEATLLPHSWLNPWAMHLHWRSVTGTRISQMVWRWQLSAPQWHAWRQRLTLQAGWSG